MGQHVSYSRFEAGNYRSAPSRYTVSVLSSRPRVSKGVVSLLNYIGKVKTFLLSGKQRPVNFTPRPSLNSIWSVPRKIPLCCISSKRVGDGCWIEEVEEI